MTDIPQNARDLIQSKGLRATSSRIAVLELLMWRAQPMSHAEVLQNLSGELWDRTTIYRNLLDLSRAGLLSRTEIGDRKWRYEFLSPNAHNDESHSHFVCTQCGRVLCLSPIDIDTQSLGWVPKAVLAGQYEVQLRGSCDDCFSTPIEEG